MKTNSGLYITACRSKSDRLLAIVFLLASREVSPKVVLYAFDSALKHYA
jgi:hypothetical protein